MLNRRGRITAGAFAIALSWGYVDLEEIQAWADSLIEISDSPEAELIELSLCEDKAESLAILNMLSSTSDFWLTASSFLSRFYNSDFMEPKEAIKLARHLSELSIRNDAPSEFQVFTGIDDELELAHSGTFGSVEEVVNAFLEDINAAVEMGAGQA